VKKLYCIVISFFLITHWAFAKENSQLGEIDKLIQEKNYNSALTKLENYITTNPEDFDQAQKRINIIMQERELYHKKAEELIATIINEPTNDLKKLQMIEELEKMEINANESTRNFIKQTKSAAQFTYYKYIFDEIMNKGKNKFQQKLYSESVAQYVEGFELYKEEFYEENYDKKFLQNVDAKIESIKSIIASFSQSLAAIEAISLEFSETTKIKNIDECEKIFAKVEKEFLAFSNLQNSLIEAALFFEESFVNLQKQNPDLNEASFLPFMIRFIRGKTTDSETGILPNFSHQWSRLLHNSLDNLVRLTNESIEQNAKILSSPEIFTKNSKKEYLSVLSEINKLLTLVQKTNNLATLAKTTQGKTENPFFSDYQEKTTEGIALISNYKNFYGFLLGEVTVLEQINSIKMPRNSYLVIKEQSVNFEQNIEKNIKSLQSQDTKLKNFKVETKTFDNNQQENHTNLIIEEFYQQFIQLIAKTSEKNNQALLQNADFFTTHIEKGTQTLNRLLEKNYSLAFQYLNKDKIIPEGQNNAYSYPDKTLQVSQQELKTIDQLLTAFTNEKITYETIITSIEEIIPVPNKKGIELLENSLSLLKTKKEEHKELIAQATEQVNLAKKAENEGNHRYTLAQQALKKDKFEQARENLTRSRTKFNESLAYRESESLRSKTDAMLLELGELIAKKENEIIVKEVRALKNSAKDAYYNGNFESAEILLTQAQNRWRTTNISNDQEIENLLSIISTALSMKTGRVISQSDPLHREMIQIINMAKNYYETGKKLLEKNNRQEALENLEKGKQKIKELQMVYPLNQEASLLSLRIDQVIDPVAFQNSFSQKVTTATNNWKDKTKQQSAYSELLDLYEINPKYPGLANTIYSIEIALGIRIPPPDPTLKKRSLKLTQEARKTINETRDEIALSGALQKLDEAIKLDADNEEAMILKDRVQTIIGGKAVTVLSAESEALYQKAVLELQKGNTIQASALVAQLLQKKENTRSSKILDLKTKVESLL